MARTKNVADTRTPPSISPKKAIELIRRQQEEGRNLLKKRPITQDNQQNWEHFTREILIKAFGLPSDQVDGFVHTGVHGYDPFQGEVYFERMRAEETESKILFLDTCIKILELDISDQPDVIDSNKTEVYSKEKSKDVFLVHGHENGVKETVARFLSKLELNPIILHEKPNQGRTIIEKFEQEHKTAAFAVILMTPDDVGASKLNSGDLKPRARQNVVLELGFFLGKLGRRNVCVLFDTSIEKPSDYDGVLFIPLNDDETWKLRLVKELKASGLEVDANKAL